MKKLSNVELKIMEKIWSNQDGVDSESIYSSFKDEYAVSTIGTILKRILQKGCAVSHRKGLHYVFVPVCEKEEYIRIIEAQELSKVYGKIEKVLAPFYGKEKLSNEQSEVLKRMLQEMPDD